MSFLKSIRKVYNATSDSRSSFGKFGRWAFPFNSQYLIRDAWRKTGKKYLRFGGASGTGVVNSAGSLYGATGSVVGRY